MIEESKFELLWSEIPIGKENAWSYGMLCAVWRMNKRQVRAVLHELSRYDNGDNLILIRSSKGDGFYRTDDPEEIKAYRAECLNKGRNTLAPLRKIDRVLTPNDGQLNMVNNLKATRLSCNLSAVNVCQRMREVDPAFDGPMLSRMENGRCFPTPIQLRQLAIIYGCAPSDLVNVDLYPTAI